MKKLLLALVLFWGVTMLAACGTPNTNDNNQEIVDNQETDTQEITDEVNVDDLGEYQFTFILKSDGEWESAYNMEMEIYQKGSKALYVIKAMPGMEDIPFQPKKTLIVDGTTYSEIEVNGEATWFKAGEDMGGMTPGDMFDLKSIQNELETTADSSKKETINGKKMICYYAEGEDGKACTYKGVFRYGEATNPADGSKIFSEVVDFKTKVDDKIFKIPTNVKDMSELVNMMAAAE